MLNLRSDTCSKLLPCFYLSLHVQVRDDGSICEITEEGKIFLVFLCQIGECQGESVTITVEVTSHLCFFVEAYPIVSFYHLNADITGHDGIGLIVMLVWENGLVVDVISITIIVFNSVEEEEKFSRSFSNGRSATLYQQA